MQAGHFEAIGLWSLLPESWMACSQYPCDGSYWAGSTTKTDVSDLNKVVRDLYDDGSPGNINVYDVLEALFYERGPGGVRNYPGWACSLVRISGKGTPAQDDDNETGLDGIARWGMDCGNVLAGSIELYDTGNGMYGLENLVAIEDFRTDMGPTQFDAVYDRPCPEKGSPYEECIWRGGSCVNCCWRGWDSQEVGHRDGYWGGAIVYPTDIMRWYYPDYYDGKYRHPWWYVNENWATTVGPGLRDGDDLDKEHDDPNVPDFNNNWSLGWLENALAKAEIWYQWFDLITADGAVVTTDVVLTFPTKHYHWFFSRFPYYNGQKGDDNMSGTTGYECCYSYSQLPPYTDCDYNECQGPAKVSDCTCPDKEPSAEQQYTGTKSWGAYWSCSTGWAASNVFTSVSAYWDAVKAFRFTDADYSCAATKNGSIATYFQAKYKNGLIATKSTMWDMDENVPKGETPEPPPGSPWRPEYTVTKYIPHEVNIVRVGEASGTGINEANWLLYSGPAAGFESGQFRLSRTTAVNSERKYWWKDECATYETCCTSCCDTEYSTYPTCRWKSEPWEWIPPIGLVYFTHTYGLDVDGITRSAMAEWHYHFGGYYMGVTAIAISNEVAIDK